MLAVTEIPDVHPAIHTSNRFNGQYARQRHPIHQSNARMDFVLPIEFHVVTCDPPGPNHVCLSPINFRHK